MENLNATTLVVELLLALLLLAQLSGPDEVNADGSAAVLLLPLTLMGGAAEGVCICTSLLNPLGEEEMPESALL